MRKRLAQTLQKTWEISGQQAYTKVFDLITNKHANLNHSVELLPGRQIAETKQAEVACGQRMWSKQNFQWWLLEENSSSGRWVVSPEAEYLRVCDLVVSTSRRGQENCECVCTRNIHWDIHSTLLMTSPLHRLPKMSERVKCGVSVHWDAPQQWEWTACSDTHQLGLPQGPYTKQEMPDTESILRESVPVQAQKHRKPPVLWQHEEMHPFWSTPRPSLQSGILSQKVPAASPCPSRVHSGRCFRDWSQHLSPLLRQRPWLWEPGMCRNQLALEYCRLQGASPAVLIPVLGATQDPALAKHPGNTGTDGWGYIQDRRWGRPQGKGHVDTLSFPRWWVWAWQGRRWEGLLWAVHSVDTGWHRSVSSNDH